MINNNTLISQTAKLIYNSHDIWVYKYKHIPYYHIIISDRLDPLLLRIDSAGSWNKIELTNSNTGFMSPPLNSLQEAINRVLLIIEETQNDITDADGLKKDFYKEYQIKLIA